MASPKARSSSGIRDGDKVEAAEGVKDKLQGGDEIREDLTPVRQENRENDTNQIVELEKREKHIQSGSVTQEISVSNLLMKVPTMQKYSDERTSRDNDPKHSFHGSGEMNHARKPPFIGEVNAAWTTVYASLEKDNAIMSVKAERNHSAIEAVGNTKCMSPRLCVPQIRLREPSSISEFDGENKKLRIACEFHAKGWCIKGNSCRFLHIKEGLGATVEKSKVSEREASSIDCITPHQIGENRRSNNETEKLVLGKDVVLGSTSSLVRESSGHNAYKDNFRSGEVSYSHSRHPPFSLDSSSQNIDALGTPNLLESSLEHHASVSSSLQRSISPVSGSKSVGLSQHLIIMDTEPAKYKTKIPYDWEPSVPFCPSHAITQNLLMKEGLYDLLHNNIEQTVVREGHVKFSCSDQGSSVKNVHVQPNSSQEEKLLNTVTVGDTVKDNILGSSCDNKLKMDNLRHKTDLKVDGSGKNDVTEVDFKIDDCMQSESKALKYFQAALIEYVKELLKPTWREGLLSKDAHKVIVKKSVDKVLSTLQPHQIPSTGESIKLYISSSQSKLEKLVEGYIHKYG